jgi:type II secretory pathway predicted ATPase ExeA
MYYAFFGLSHPPFKITPDTDVFFEGGNRGAILNALIYAISQGEGIIKVTGEVGSGKTMLCRMLQSRLPENVETIYLANPSVSPDEILHAIAFEMQLGVAREAGRLQVMHSLNEYLLERHAQGRQVVLFIEESQGMPIPTLEEIRLLSNLETNQHKLLQIVLFGQPELDDNLRQPQIRQLRERVVHSFSLAPLTARDISAYLSFRLHAAGYRGPDLFGKRVVEDIARASEGLTRRVNIIADKALLAAFAEGTHNVSPAHVKAAVRDSEFSGKALPAPTRQLSYALGGVLVGGVLGVAAFAGYEALREQASQNTASQYVTPEPAAGPSSAEPAQSEPASAQPAPPADAAPAVEAVTGETVASLPAPAPEISAVPLQDTALAVQVQPQVDVLEQRLLETERWLTESAGNLYSIQLLGSSDRRLLRNHLNTIAKFLEIEKVFVYRTVARERPSLTVMYGSFASRAEASAEIERLPPELKANRPYYRTIKGIRAEIASHRS